MYNLMLNKILPQKNCPTPIHFKNIIVHYLEHHLPEEVENVPP